MKTRRTQIAMGLALAAALAAGGAAVAWRGGSRAAGSGSAGVMPIGPRVPGPTADQEGSRPPGGRSAIGLQTTATARTAARGAEDGVVGMPPARKQRSAKLLSRLPAPERPQPFRRFRSPAVPLRGVIGRCRHPDPRRRRLRPGRANQADPPLRRPRRARKVPEALRKAALTPVPRGVLRMQAAPRPSRQAGPLGPMDRARTRHRQTSPRGLHRQSYLPQPAPTTPPTPSG